MISEFNNIWPELHESVFVALSAHVIGDVIIGENSSVWFNSVVRGDVNYIRIGKNSNVQDGCVLHVTKEAHPLIIEDSVTIGHGVIVHGCTIHSNTLLGIGSVILDGAIVNEYSMVAAGALVPPGFEVPSGALVMGSPARVKRELTEKELKTIDELANRYVKYSRLYLSQGY